MFDLKKIILPSIILLLSFTSLFLSFWVIVPPPNMFLLILAVGVPEVSPLLFGLNLLFLLLSFFYIRQRQLKYITYVLNLTGLLIYASVLVNIPLAQIQMTKAMQIGLGTNYIEKIPAQVRAKMQPHPFSLVNSFLGIPVGKTRHQTGILFATPAGVPLTLEVYQPLEQGKYPALVVIYGGAWRSGTPHANSDFNQYMASHGYTVFAIDYRHAPKFHFPSQLDDVNTALNFIREHAREYLADPERMILLGRSAGAHLAMLQAYHSNALGIRAVVNYYGPVDLTEGYKTPPRPDPINSRAVLTAFIGGSLQQLPQQFQIASPINYVTSSLPPTLLIYASHDHLVQPRFGRQMFQRLRESGNTAIYLEIPWAEHAFDAIFNGVSNQLALYYTERFLAWVLFNC